MFDFARFPFTKSNVVNLDWIMGTLRDLLAGQDAVQQAATEAAEAAESATESAAGAIAAAADATQAAQDATAAIDTVTATAAEALETAEDAETTAQAALDQIGDAVRYSEQTPTEGQQQQARANIGAADAAAVAAAEATATAASQQAAAAQQTATAAATTAAGKATIADAVASSTTTWSSSKISAEIAAASASAPSDAVPLRDAAVGSAGTAATYARGDHVHPSNVVQVPMTVSTGSWMAGSGYYYKALDLSGTDAGVNTRVDITLDAAVVIQMIADGVQALLVVNNGSTFDLVAVGAAPTAAFACELYLTEVSS